MNRGIVLLAALLGVAASGGVVAVASGVPPRPALDLLAAPYLWLARLGEAAPRARWISGLVAALCGLVLLLIVWAELRSISARRRREIVVSRAESGAITVSRIGLARLAEHIALEFEDVVEARAEIVGDDRLAVSCRARVTPSAVAPELSRSLQRALRDALSRQLGRELDAVDVHSQFGPLDGGARAVRVR